MGRVVTTLAAVAVLAALTGCPAKGADDAAEEAAREGSATSDGTTTTAAGDSGSDSFGDLPSPCGEGSAKVTATDAGRGTDKLYIGVANDRTGIRAGLLKELFDGASGFAGWCNAQGGVDGVPIEVVDLDGKIFEVDKAMATACTDVFALVGGGWAQDDLAFSGKDGSDLHKCGLIAIPGFAVSDAMAGATDVVQPIPNPPNSQTLELFEMLAKLYPDSTDQFGTVYVNIPSATQDKDQALLAARSVKGFGGFGAIPYDPISQDWAVVAQQVIDQEMEIVYFNGEPTALSKLSQALKDQGWDGVLQSEVNEYDTRLIESSGAAAVEGDIVRVGLHPFEEADQWPATKQFLQAMDDNVPDWQHAGLAVAAFSASLLFATSAHACAADGEITRKCVLEKAMDTHEWTAGGLHANGDPGANKNLGCSALVIVKNGTFERLFPEIGSKDDSGGGFYCSKAKPVTVPSGEGNRDSSILDEP